MTRNLIDAYLEEKFGVEILEDNGCFKVIKDRETLLYVGATYMNCIEYVQDVLLEEL